MLTKFKTGLDLQRSFSSFKIIYQLIGSDSPSFGQATKAGTSNSIPINNLEVWLSGLRHFATFIEVEPNSSMKLYGLVKAGTGGDEAEGCQ